VLRRALSQVERPTDFIDRPSLVMAKGEGRSLDGREIVERLVHALVDLCALGEAIGCGPRQLRVGRRLIEDLGFGVHAMAAGAHHVHRAIGSDAIQPGAEVGPGLKSAELAIGAEKTFLHNIFGILFVSRHAEGELKHSAAVLLDQRPERFFISLPRPNERGRPVTGVHLGA